MLLAKAALLAVQFRHRAFRGSIVAPPTVLGASQARSGRCQLTGFRGMHGLMTATAGTVAGYFRRPRDAASTRESGRSVG
jgi:hypothetical protein